MISDDQIREAAEQYAYAMLDRLPKELPGHTFSPRFERKMKRLIHREKYAAGYRVLKGAAAAVLAAVIGFGLLAAFNSDVRAAVTGWIRGIAPGFFEYRFSGETEEHEKHDYDLGWVPEGFHIYEQRSWEDGGWSIYIDDKETVFLALNYEYGIESAAMFLLQAEAYTLLPSHVGPYPADFYRSDDPAHTNELVWADPENGVLFSLSGPFDEDELIRLAESAITIEKNK